MGTWRSKENHHNPDRNIITIGYTSHKNTLTSLKRPEKEGSGPGDEGNLMIIQITIILGSATLVK